MSASNRVRIDGRGALPGNDVGDRFGECLCLGLVLGQLAEPEERGTSEPPRFGPVHASNVVSEAVIHKHR
jgi:hypothetical protein